MTRLALAALLVFAADLTPIAGSDGATVTLSAGSSTARSGELIHVTVKIQGARDVGSVPFTLHYDPAVLELLPTASQEGGFLKRDRTATTFLVSPGPASRPGTVLVGLSRLGGAQSSKGAGGKGTLCRLTFRARIPGVSSLTFSKAAVMDPSANQLEATFRGTSIRVKRRT